MFWRKKDSVSCTHSWSYEALEATDIITYSKICHKCGLEEKYDNVDQFWEALKEHIVETLTYLRERDKAVNNTISITRTTEL